MMSGAMKGGALKRAVTLKGVPMMGGYFEGWLP